MLRVADREPLGETKSQRRKMAAILVLRVSRKVPEKKEGSHLGAKGF